MPLSDSWRERFKAALRAGNANAEDGEPYLAVQGSINVGSLNVAQVQPTEATVHNVAAATGNTVLKLGNASRRGLAIFNESPADLYVALGIAATIGAAPTNSRFTVRLTASAYYELLGPVYTGTVSGVWGGPSGAALITELY